MIKLTKKRKKVYDCLTKTTKPLSVEDIFKHLNDNEINLSTVYRTIDFLESNDLLLKFHFNSKYYYLLNENNEHSHYFICTNCHVMHKIQCQMKTIIDSLEINKDFLVTNHEMNVYGLCNKCH